MNAQKKASPSVVTEIVKRSAMARVFRVQIEPERLAAKRAGGGEGVCNLRGLEPPSAPTPTLPREAGEGWGGGAAIRGIRAIKTSSPRRIFPVQIEPEGL
jgi:hypothetical protein